MCLCPTSTFGIECYFKNEHCERNPCLNGGTCIVTYDFTDINKFLCICTDFFQGVYCQTQKGMVNITLVLSENSVIQRSEVVAETVFYSDYGISSLRFVYRHQRVYAGFSSELKLAYDKKRAKNAPTTAVLKVYEKSSVDKKAKYFLLYFHRDQQEMNLTSDLAWEHYCPLVETLWHLVERTGENVEIFCLKRGEISF